MMLPRRYKQLTLWQPWATLVATGAKGIESRGWETDYRGPLLIHAAARWKPDQSEMLAIPAIRDALADRGDPPPDGCSFVTPDGLMPLPLGAIVAVVMLADIRPTWEAGHHGLVPARWAIRLDPAEAAMGDFSIGRYGWTLADVRPLPSPVPARGFQGLRDADPAIVARVLAQLEAAR